MSNMPNLLTRVSNTGLNNPFGNISVVCSEEDANGVQIIPLSLFFDRMHVYFNVFGFVMLNWIVGYANSYFIITV